MIYGRTVDGPDRLALAADRAYLFDVGDELEHPLVVGSVVVRLDGLGGGTGEQRIRPIVAEAEDLAGTLAIGDEVVVEQDAPADWVHLTFDLPPTLNAGRTPRLGLVTGAASNLARIVGTNQAAVGQRWTAVYGTTPDFAPAAADPGVLASICAVGVIPWAPPDNLTDEELASLPLDVAQGVLGTGGPIAEGVAAVAGWHYDHDDPPLPATAIVRTGGPLAELVGERIRVTADTESGPRSVVVLVDDERPFDDELADEDLSLARGAFDRLAPLWTESLPVTVVEVL